MLRTDSPRHSTAATGMAILLSVAPGLHSAAQAEASSAAPVQNGASQVAITITADNGGACVLDHNSAAAGPVTFAVTNKTGTAITEIELQSSNRILGEKENLAPGLPTVSFTLTLGGGTYQIYCPGAAQEMQDFTVTGATAAQPTGGAAALLA